MSNKKQTTNSNSNTQSEDSCSVAQQTSRESEPNLWQVASSVAAAFFGVQSDKNRQRDFSSGKFSHFVIIGAIGVVIFVGILIAIVAMVLPS